ncbi:MAG: MFS transporter [Spirochaetales bacterium]|nr:MFS transporter [Spirochaetales bacterium]
MKEKKIKMKGFYKTTFLIGLGFFTMGLMDPLYDSFVPLFLKKYTESLGVIGTIMTLDNIFAIFLIPIVAALSDRTMTRIGRRMPYIIVTLPMTAIFFAMIPFSAAHSLWLLILVIFFLNAFKQAARGPVVALMPDIIPGEYRSEANGVINTMGGIAAIVGTIGLAKLFDISVDLPIIGNTHSKLPFMISSLLVIIAVILLFSFVKERDAIKHTEETKEKVKTFSALEKIFTSSDKSAIFILMALFCWFMAYQGILPFLSIYSVEKIGVTEGTAGMGPGFVAIAYALFAIPSGIIGHKIGRKRLIKICLIALSTIILLMFFHHPLCRALNFSTKAELFTFWGMLFLFGIFWGSVVTNSFPMLWQMATYSDMGIYTGSYYFFSQGAAILAPILFGGLSQALGIKAMFIIASIFMALAFVMISFVKRGDANDKPLPADIPELD